MASQVSTLNGGGLPCLCELAHVSYIEAVLVSTDDTEQLQVKEHFTRSHQVYIRGRTTRGRWAEQTSEKEKKRPNPPAALKPEFTWKLTKYNEPNLTEGNHLF